MQTGINVCMCSVFTLAQSYSCIFAVSLCSVIVEYELTSSLTGS